ncbi:Vegetative incompatibility protein HET-E-1-like protein 2 [Colletotrichum plurivorum]|uniref:Vegetative incompatibility protein HET-E-1-like protein 2 n=1 Tax=Colletotrichum plurivorum TaxID=2175906 RepID=A0A8H6JFI1_9PEZI|nr:Vegetative incompatibility protein HET-E-1-like protein 2 [Colletotrichum plurivorum]
MRLINTATLALEEFFGDNIPPYAILSHVWGPEEVTFQDWHDLAKAREKQGFQKIELARNQALANDLGWLWVDTNCINKESSAELSEAVNSMFAWYRDAEYCYAYLADVSEAGDPDEAASKRQLFPRISRSRWFTRGWTLQELLAPRSVFFFSREWRQVGTRKSLADVIAGAAHIRAEYLYNGKKRKGNSRLAISEASVAERMSWLSRRETTRAEDMAYCMLGIFDINMPLLYGEGSRAFTRLQEEILKTSTDETLFSWSWSEDDPAAWSSMLAPSPRSFKHAADYRPVRNELERPVPYAMTNFGLSIRLPIVRVGQMPRSAVDRWLRAFEYVALLSVTTADGYIACIPLEKTQAMDTYRVVRDSPRPITLRWKTRLLMRMEGLSPKPQDIFVPSREPGWNVDTRRAKAFDESLSLGKYAVLLLMFNTLDLAPVVTSIDAIPRHRKSKAGFLTFKKFIVIGAPSKEQAHRSGHFHAVEVYGSLARINCDAFRDAEGPLCLLFGVLVGERGETSWFRRLLANTSGDVDDTKTASPFNHGYLESLLLDEASNWNWILGGSTGITDSPKAEDTKAQVSTHADVSTKLGPEFLVDANHQETTAKAVHIVIGKPQLMQHLSSTF